MNGCLIAACLKAVWSVCFSDNIGAESRETQVVVGWLKGVLSLDAVVVVIVGCRRGVVDDLEVGVDILCGILKRLLS